MRLTNDGDVRRVLSLYALPIYRLAYARTRSQSDAEDVCQEVFLELVSRNPSFPSENARRAWLIRVTMNKSNSLWRSLWHRRVELRAQVEMAAVQNDASTALADALSALSEDDRIFYICHGEGTDRSALVWTVLDGRPVEIQNASKIYDLYSTRGALAGHAAFQDYDVAFLGVDVSDPENVYLYQIEGIELTREQFLTFPGAQEVIELVEGEGVYSIYQILYWQDCAMALNFMQTEMEMECTTYLYFVDGKLQCMGGWFGDDIGLGSGRATTFRDLPIPVRYTQLTPQTE